MPPEHRPATFPPRRIASALAAPSGFVVTVAWQDGETDQVDLEPWMRGRFVPTMSAQAFRGVVVGEYGWTLSWLNGRVELDSIHLQRLHAEQTFLP